MEEWIQKMWYICTMEYYSAIKSNEFRKSMKRRCVLGSVWRVSTASPTWEIVTWLKPIRITSLTQGRDGAPGDVPGPDIIFFLKLFHNIEREGTLPNSFYEASITLITKPRKDPNTLANFRPISLMNINTKMLNKILENQIQEHIKTIIHHSQVRFIPGRQGLFNIWKSINAIHYINKVLEK